ncbi:caspase [Brachionus plicatilis]|uniref:Caspase n=1 Tax=Brachionus plicatilis TaxID=10195 RepID=A0A3M7Q2P6_BRAPC|nr:caspase [Brachionus plicatilis]
MRVNSATRDLDLSSPDQVAQDSPLVYRPQTYHIDWSDVNALELDFPVYRTLPDLRKQLTSDECYQMEQVARGICLIISNERFYDANGVEIGVMRRYGTDKDAARLRNLFEKLNFNVEMFVDLKEAEMRQVIGLLVNKCDSHGHLFDAICFVVLSHGTDGYVYGVDYENKLNMDKDILNMFDDVLVGKPKMFIFQACRGGK